jgi:hypothetical protein
VEDFVVEDFVVEDFGVEDFGVEDFGVEDSVVIVALEDKGDMVVFANCMEKIGGFVADHYVGLLYQSIMPQNFWIYGGYFVEQLKYFGL